MSQRCQQPTTRNGSSACDAAVSPSAFATCSFLARFNFIERTYKAMGEDSRIDPSQYLLIVSAEYGGSKELLGGSSCRMLRKLLQ
jgi:hypothetical protein